MAFVFQHSCAMGTDTNVEEDCWAAVAINEKNNPIKSYHFQLIWSDAVHSESTALRAAATHAVNLDHAAYGSDRLYIALAAPSSASKKRKAGETAASAQFVVAMVGYDYTP